MPLKRGIVGGRVEGSAHFAVRGKNIIFREKIEILLDRLIAAFEKKKERKRV